MLTLVLALFAPAALAQEAPEPAQEDSPVQQDEADDDGEADEIEDETDDDDDDEDDDEDEDDDDDDDEIEDETDDDDDDDDDDEDDDEDEDEDDDDEDDDDDDDDDDDEANDDDDETDDDETDPEAKKASWERTGLGFGGVPALNYNSDEGFGYGVLFTVYKYDGQTAPYKWALTTQLFMTTRGVHSHYLDLDALKLAKGKLRLNARARFGATKAENYCGVGNNVSCDPEQAVARADSMGLVDDPDDKNDAYDQFVRRYYFNRIFEPFVFVNGRYMLSDKPHRVELIGGYRLTYLASGDLTESGPFPGNLYSETYPDGEKARTGVVQAGIMFDNRDNEPSPQSGYWAEATLRGSHPVLGSTQGIQYVGFNTTLRGYLPIVSEGRLAFADRLMVDGIVGNATTQELGWVGGSSILTGIGGAELGRGIRQRRFRGPLKAINQAELRWRFANIDLGFPFEMYLVGFADVAMVTDPPTLDPNAPTDDRSLPLHVGQGAGLRLAFDKNFIIRVDTGFSADEDYGMGLYITTGNLF